MRTLQGFLIIMGVIAVIAIIALIAGYILSILTPDLRDSMRPVVLSAEAADSLTSKVSELHSVSTEAQSKNSQKDMRLVITEEEINSSLVMMLAEGNLPAKEILVNFNEDYAVIYIGWNFPWYPVKTVFLGQFETVDGSPKVIVRNVYVGKLTVPNNLNENIQNLINVIVKLNAPLEDMKLNIKQISVGDGQMVITGTAGKSD